VETVVEEGFMNARTVEEIIRVKTARRQTGLLLLND
jgi:hypothetical protein